MVLSGVPPLLFHCLGNKLSVGIMVCGKGRKAISGVAIAIATTVHTKESTGLSDGKALDQTVV